MNLSREDFISLVAEALDDLPAAFREKLDNVDVVVEDWADGTTLRLAHVPHPAQLLGFYHGVPQTKRTHHYGLVLPDKITLYRGPISLRCRTLDEARKLTAHVLRHEIAHHFGISDARLRELGAY